MLRVSGLIDAYAKMTGNELPSYQIRLIEEELVGRLQLGLNDIAHACRHVAYSGKELTLKNLLFAIPDAWPRAEEAKAMLFYADKIPTLAVEVGDIYGLFGRDADQAFIESYEKLVLQAWANGEVRAKWVTRDELVKELQKRIDVKRAERALKREA
jgi:hypothetical protein